MSNAHQNPSEENYELKKFITQITSNWYWIFASLLVAVTIAFLIIRYSSPVYVVSASFITKKFDKTSTNPLLQMTGARGIFQDNIQIAQEIPLLKSQDRIQGTLNRLDFGISYFAQGRLKTTELYPDDFYKVINEPGTGIPAGIRIFIETADHQSFQLSTEQPGWAESISSTVFQFGKKYEMNGWKFTIQLLHENGTNRDDSHYFVIHSPDALFKEYDDKLRLSWQGANSSILDARIETQLPRKDYDFLTAYLQVIVDKGLEDKNQQYTNTIDFINEYLPQISDTINSYQSRINEFKLENSRFLGDEEIAFRRINELEDEKTDLYISNRYYDYLTDYIREEREEGIFAPVTLGLESSLMSKLMGMYTDAQWLDKLDKNPDNQSNPLVNKSATEIERIRLNIFENAKNLKQANREQINEINQEILELYTSIEDYQVESQEYEEIKRQVSLYESVYFNLITRRTEVFLSQAATVSDYELVTNPSYDDTHPIAPDKERIYLIALIIGLGVPVGLIYLGGLLNTKVVSLRDLSRNTHIPVLGYVGHSIDQDNLVVHHQPKSLVAESFRNIRASLKYMVEDPDRKVVLISSSLSGEGKTFCSINLAFTYALSKKKVLLIGADMRKPALSRSFGLERTKGLSNYLAGMTKLEECVYETDNEHLQVIPSGNTPPNPAELLMNKHMSELITWAESRYDHIVIDTPPISLVADAYELMKFASVNLLIVRQHVTSKDSFKFINTQYENGQLQHLSILFNDVDFRKLDYGYRSYRAGYSYGYGYYAEESAPQATWWKRILGKK